MALALKAPHLNSDGERHPRENALALTSLTLGVLSFGMAATWTDTTALFHYVGLAIGVVGVLVSIVAQMVSVTTGERWTIVPGWVLSFMAAALNLYLAVQ